MMQHQPIVKRVNGTHKWAYMINQLLITAACTNTGGKMKDRPTPPPHDISMGDGGGVEPLG